ncbi:MULTISPECIES: chorismate synthase [Lachnospiraceae]|uniref:Chorismate synthase n=1 Tax=Faecalicatena acetigenes TaxID=2981790 RepID=A0ABT2T904_9FIRM|nr:MULTISPECIES: chorismate synthase [Lachnospiraceae]MCU6746755.1 chorismate synthase [Faecalicatena acetigenes]SCH39812.1 Chorismate synthase [uncultured Clostridium sp.]
MSGSTFGKLFRITTWGESHGPAVGVTVDGCPAGLALTENDIQVFLDRRKPGQNKYTTRRSEEDTVEILSGVFEGYTTGTPISLLIHNKDQRSRDYGNIAEVYRPGHADYPFQKKYGFRDYRGGGRSSGRETIGRVAAGAVASLLLKELGITVTAYTKSIGPYTVKADAYHLSEISENPLFMPSNEVAKKAGSYLDTLIKELNSSGGTIECIAQGLPVGIGEPVFDKLDALLAQAIMSVGAVKAVEIGDGIAVSNAIGSENNDSFFMEGEKIAKRTNHSGGTLGGMSDGSCLILRASIKPTSSISRQQHTVTVEGQDTEISIHGRHDPVIVPRAVVVIESMTAITLADLLLQNMASQMEHVKKIYAEDKNVE